MIWLSSFPRSGNTFFRNVLYEVYGLESTTFHLEPGYHLDENYADYPFVKTHLLPDQLKPGDSSIPAIYIIRDGRDALVSMAHHRKDIIAPGSDFYENLKVAIIADRGSFFGGWSENVSEWILRADMVIRYEDLLIDPVKEAERMRALFDLPKPDESRVPRFEQLKFGIPQYGSGKVHGFSEARMKELAQKNFRKGRAGSWKEEMPEELVDLFWSYHGDTMERVGYTYDGKIKDLHTELDYLLIDKLGKTKQETRFKPKRILIESNKVVSPDNDGVKRYQIELLKGFLPLVENPDSGWQIDLFIHGKIFPLPRFKESILEDFSNGTLKEARHQERDKTFFERVEQILIKLVPNSFVSFLAKHEIKVFHNIYEFLKKMLRHTIDVMLTFVNYIKLLLYRLFNVFEGSISGFRLEKQFNQYDLIHLPLMHHYLPFRRSKAKILTTVHDLTHVICPQFHTKINIENSAKGMDFVLNIGSDVIAVSHSTKNDLLKEYNMKPEKVFMVHEAADKKKFNFKINQEDNSKVLDKYGIAELGNYLVCLSTIEPRKNLENTMRGFKLLIDENPDIPLHLVIAGKKGWENNDSVFNDPAYLRNVVFIGFVDDEDISAIYSNAVAMSYLSFYEGFGLPPLEAMCCSTPVIYGNNSSLIEVVGPGGLACKPDDINEIKEKFEQIFFDKELRARKSREALKQSLGFSWRKTVEQTLDVYKQIIEK
ncbi:MAG: glycosyltransferase [Bacteroidales bacterium]|nr:glycosyltransferase [Bacteroidales bacterium]